MGKPRTLNAKVDENVSPEVRRAVEEVFHKAEKHWSEVEDFVEPTVQLLQRDGYYAVSVLDVGFDLVALSRDHLLLGYVSALKRPAAEDLEMFRRIPAPAGTRKVIFRWHSLEGVPDRIEVR